MTPSSGTTATLNCPACAAPVAGAGTCPYCGATVVVGAPESRGGRPDGAGRGMPLLHPRAVGPLVDVIMPGLQPEHVALLVEVLRRPPGRMAEVPFRRPPAVFQVPPELAAELRERLAPLGVTAGILPARSSLGPGTCGAHGGPPQAAAAPAWGPRGRR